MKKLFLIPLAVYTGVGMGMELQRSESNDTISSNDLDFCTYNESCADCKRLDDLISFVDRISQDSGNVDKHSKEIRQIGLSDGVISAELQYRIYEDTSYDESRKLKLYLVYDKLYGE